MKKLEGNKLVAVLLSACTATTLLAACSINNDELGQGIRDLGNAFTSQTESEPEKTKETTETTETEETSATTEESVAETTPAPTATPTMIIPIVSGMCTVMNRATPADNAETAVDDTVVTRAKLMRRNASSA